MSELAATDSSPAPAGVVLALAADLLFESRIRATGAALGVPVVSVRSGHFASAPLASAIGVLVDLELEAAAEFVRIVRERRPDLPLIGYFPHVRADIARQARSWGITRTLTRSQFTERLADLLRELAGNPVD